MASLLPKSLVAPLDEAPPMLPNALGDQLAAVTQDQPIARMPQFAEPAPKPVYAPDPEQQMIDRDTQQLQKIHWKQENPWGTANNHPGIGGKIAHVLSVAGQIGGNIVAPNLVRNIDGSQSNLAAREAGLNERLGEEQTAQGQNREREAQTGLVNQQAADEPGKAKSLEDYQSAETKKINDEIQQGPNLAIGHAHAVNQAIKRGVDPATDPLVLQYEDAIQRIQKPVAPKGAHFIQREVGGKPHTVAVDDLTGADIKDEGETGEKPPVVNVNAATSALDRETARFAKPYEKAVADANTQLDKIADARSMINGSAEAQALGVPKVLTALVSGAGSGVRITQPELNAIATARGLSGNIEGTLNSWAGQGKLTATQKQQLTGILDDVKARILAKQQIHNEALDKINSAPDRNTVLQTEKDVRKRLSDLEQGGGGAKEGDTKVNSAGIKVKFSGGKWGPA